jgi:hypothetical protein
MNNAVLSIGVTEAKDAAEKETTLENQLKAAMRVMNDHWMITDPDEQLQAAVAAVVLLSEEETQARITQEWKALASLSATIAGLPIDMSRIEFPENPIGIMKLWQAIKGQP